MNTDWDTASTSPEPSSPRSSVDAWSPPPSPWLSNAAPTTSTQSNPTEQFQHYGQMAIWGDASVSETCMEVNLFPRMQPSSSYINPQEAIGSDGRSVANLELEGNLGFDNGNSCDTWSSLQPNEASNVAPTNLNQHNPMEQPQNYGQTAAWNVDFELQRGHVNLQEGGLFETRDAATPLAPTQYSFDTQQFSWLSNAAPSMSIQYNPMDQIQDLGQTPTWNVNSLPAASDMVNTTLPRLQPSGSYINPQEVVLSDTRYATASAPPHSFINTGYSQHSTWPSNVATPTFTRYNPMEQFQDLGQLPSWSANSPPLAPCAEAYLFPKTQPFKGDMIILLEVGHSKTKCAVEVKQNGCLGSGNGKRKRSTFNAGTLSILEKHYLETPYLDRAQKKDLMNQTGLTAKQVNKWFEKRRKHDRTAGVEVKHNRYAMSSPLTASSTPNLSMPMFDNPPMMAPEGFQMPMQQFPPQMAMNPTFQQTAALQNPAQPQSTNFYYQR